MTNVDIALISGHDLRNDNIGLLRLIGDDDKAPPHPQLIKLFEHYKYVLNLDQAGHSSHIADEVLYKGGIFWVYAKFFELYGEQLIYKTPIHTSHKQNEIFFIKYLLKVDPLLISLSFNSMAYLFFCTEEHTLVQKIINRLIFLTSVWRTYTESTLPASVILPTVNGGQVTVASYWVKYVPSFDSSGYRGKDFNLKVANLLPKGFADCIRDLFTTWNIFKKNANQYHTVPSDVNHTIYLRIHVSCAKTISELLEVIKGIDNMFFDPEFIFSGLQWSCTHTELSEAGSMRQGSRAYHNANVWLLLCYLHHNGKLTINGIPHIWKASEAMIGPAMFDYCVNKNKEGILKFLKFMQYIKNRDASNSPSGEALEKLIKKYREFGLSLDVKALKIKRGILINFLSAGLGDIFCHNT